MAGKHSVLLANTDRASIGDEVEYSYTILNDGTTTLSDAVISDDKVCRAPPVQLWRTVFHDMSGVEVHALGAFCFPS